MEDDLLEPGMDFRSWAEHKRDKFIRDKLEKCMQQYCHLKVLRSLNKTRLARESASSTVDIDQINEPKKWMTWMTDIYSSDA